MKDITEYPYLSHIEINLTELCNLKCLMCPRSQDYPNRNLHMTLDTHYIVMERIKDFIDKNKDFLAGQHAQNKTGLHVQLIGRGEPSLYKHYRQVLEDYIEFVKEWDFVNIMVVTNGYKIEEYEDLYKQVGTSLNLYYNKKLEDFYYYKKRYEEYPNIVVHWRNEAEDTLNKRPNDTARGYNNRAGKIYNEFTTLNHSDITTLNCNKPFTNIFIDWNGDYNLCCNDWEYLKVLGNVKEESIQDYYFKNATLLKYKRMLLNGKRNSTPCSTCNARCPAVWLNSLNEATLVGYNIKN